MATQIWQNANLKKNEVSVRIGALCNAVNFIKHFAQWVAKDSVLLQADSEDSDQTGRMCRLIRVFAGRTVEDS